MSDSTIHGRTRKRCPFKGTVLKKSRFRGDRDPMEVIKSTNNEILINLLNF